LRPYELLGVSGAHGRDGHLRRVGLRARMRQRDETVRGRVHSQCERMQRHLPDRYSQLQRHLSIGYQRELLRSALHQLPRAGSQRNGRLQRRNVRRELQRFVPPVPGNDALRADQRRLLRQ